jgi:hypothetical protein
MEIAMTDQEIKLFILKQEKRKENMRHKEKITKINNEIDAIKRTIETSSGCDK